MIIYDTNEKARENLSRAFSLGWLMPSLRHYRWSAGY